MNELQPFEPDIDLSPEMIQNVSKGMDEDFAIIQFVSGSKNGEDFWAYIGMKPTRYLEYYDRVNKGDVMDLAEYGEILEEGSGLYPPQEIQDAYTKNFGNSPEMEAEMLAIGNEVIEEIKGST